MDRNVRMAKSVLAFLFLTTVLFAALALLPAWAQEPERADAAPQETVDLGQVSAQALVSSTTGYLIDDGATGYSQSAVPDGWTTVAAGYDGDFRYTDVTAGIERRGPRKVDRSSAGSMDSEWKWMEIEKCRGRGL